MTCEKKMSKQEKSNEVKRSQSCKTVVGTPTKERKTSLDHFYLSCRSDLAIGSDEELSADVSDDRMRNFVSKKNGRIVNRGDSCRKEWRKGNAIRDKYRLHKLSQSSGDDSLEGLQRSCTLPSFLDPLRTEDTEKHRVLLLGAAEVGKTAISRQFQTSEYRSAYDQTLDFRNKCRKVPVCLDGIETELSVNEITCCESEILDDETVRENDAFVIVYSVSDSVSFIVAKTLCQHLDRPGFNKPVILVANKCDLVRLRKVSAKDGRALALEHGFKYTETSVVINNNIDELLAGVVAQTRLFHQSEDTTSHQCRGRRHHRREKRTKSRTLPSFIMQEIFHKVLAQRESKSCQNLLVL